MHQRCLFVVRGIDRGDLLGAKQSEQRFGISVCLGQQPFCFRRTGGETGTVEQAVQRDSLLRRRAQDGAWPHLITPVRLYTCYLQVRRRVEPLPDFAALAQTELSALQEAFATAQADYKGMWHSLTPPGRRFQSGKYITQLQAHPLFRVAHPCSSAQRW